MKDDAVIFKGYKEGLQVLFNDEASFDTIKECFISKLDAHRHFFDGSRVKIVFMGKTLQESEKNELKSILYDQYKLTSMEIVEDLPHILEMDDTNENGSKGDELPKGVQEGKSIFIRNTIRNGQRICYDGDVVILGDVNPGAEIIASGNIAVMGTLRGMAHAGATGNQEAVVAAFNLQPTQLRIAGIITRPPEGDCFKPSYPELARIKDNAIIIEPYLSSIRGR